MRRLSLVLAVLVALSVVVSGPPSGAQTSGAQASGPPTVVVLVVDGLLPDEVGPTTPTLQSLKDAGTWFEESRSVMIAETIPNHVAMMTGVYPERSNISANSFWDRDESELDDRDLSDPAELTADTLFTTLDRACPDIATASILSKTYLYEIFQAGGQNVAADFHWEPGPIIPESGHTPDTNTMDQVLGAVDSHDFLFVNLGDVDRSGHVDITGGLFEVPADLGIPSLPTPNNAAARQVVLRNTDVLIGGLVQALQDAGRWDETVLFVVSDHGMDWSDPLGFVRPQPVLDGVESGRFFVVQNGGAMTVYLRNPGQADDGADLRAAREALLQAFPTEIDQAWYPRPNPADPAGNVFPEQYRIDSPNAGDLVLLATDGWRFTDESTKGNPLPGNHGHFETRHNTFLVTGGHPGLAAAQSVAAPAADPGNAQNFENQSENVDVAPTVAWLLGLPTDGYQGRVLREAFAGDDVPVPCSSAAASPGGQVAGPAPVAEPSDPRVAADPTLPATGSSGGGLPVAVALLLGVGALVVRRWFVTTA